MKAQNFASQVLRKHISKSEEEKEVIFFYHRGTLGILQRENSGSFHGHAILFPCNFVNNILCGLVFKLRGIWEENRRKAVFVLMKS